MSILTTADQHRELAEAAAIGIREFLGTARGANYFGANATVTYNSAGEIQILHGSAGTVTFFRPVSM